MLLYNTAVDEYVRDLLLLQLPLPPAHLDSPGGGHTNRTDRWHSCKPHPMLENLSVKWIQISMNEWVLNGILQWPVFIIFFQRNLEQNASLNLFILFTLRCPLSQNTSEVFQEAGRPVPGMEGWCWPEPQSLSNSCLNHQDQNGSTVCYTGQYWTRRNDR
jgi:hypothetical protein